TRWPRPVPRRRHAASTSDDRDPRAAGDGSGTGIGDGRDAGTGVGDDPRAAGTPETGRVHDGPVGTVDRRGLLVAGGTAAGLVVLAAGTGLGGQALQTARFSAAGSRARVRIPRPVSAAKPVPDGTRRPVHGITPWRTSNETFYRVDTAITLPQVPADTWKLRVHGMVEHELTLSYDELLRRDLIERDITLTCVSNEVGGHLAGNARWIGAPLRDLLRQAGVSPHATQLVSRSADGMTIGTPVEAVLDGRDAILAVAMNGEPLPVKHGFPVRMIVPGLYGYVSACKWLVDLEATTYDAYDPYWVKRKWAAKAPIKTASRIDTPKPFGHAKAGTVMIAGVAWAQHRGIRRVEVRVDDGAWQPARLAATPDSDVWRQWVYTWSGAKPGDHQITVRATDATGGTQTEKRASPFPNGSSGWHSISVTVDG
ncbi:MAG: molybdopterin-dependent oxidoreductase, partial [Actinocatenispora sp.]